MRITTACSAALLALVSLVIAAPVLAQSDGAAQLQLIVIDQTNGGVPTATVTITVPGSEPVSVMTDEKGVATFPTLTPGVAKVRAEFPGFDPYVGQVTLKRGTNSQTVTLNLGGVQEEVTVKADAGVDTSASGGMVTTLDEAQINELPDDPDELEAVLTQLAGPAGAVFKVDGFTGGRLPSRDEIRMIRFRSNSFSADNHDAGRTQVEIITKPNVQNWGGNANVQFRGDGLDARNPFAQVESPEQNSRAGFSLRGPLTSKTSLRISSDGSRGFNSGVISAIDPSGVRLGDQVRQPFDQTNFMAGIEHALTDNQTLRLQYRHGQNESDNQGVGNFNLAERASNQQSTNDQVRLQVQGLVGKTTLNELRVETNYNRSEATSLTDAPSIVVLDAFSAGGAGVDSNASTRSFEIADNLDFTPAKNHQMRVGVLLQGAQYQNFDATNALGTFTFSSLEAYRANQPLQFTQRQGTVDTSFSQYQLGLYWQDEMRVNKQLTLSFGLRNEMQSHVSDRFNLMPRVGFNVTPWGSKTSIRGGYGIFTDWYDASLYDQTLRVNGIAQRDLLILNPGYPNPFTGGDELILASGRIQADPDLQMPYVHQASIGIERQLTPNVTLQTSYQMLRGRNQLRAVNVNAPVDGVRPEPGVGTVTQFESTGRMTSDRLTVQSNIRMPAQHITANVSYALGRVLNDADSATALPADSLNPDAEWGPSAQDIRHTVTAMFQLPLVLGIRSTTQFQARSGAAYTMTTGIDNNLDGIVNDRPDGVGRNTLRADPTWDLGFRLARSFGFGGTRSTPGGTGRPQQGQAQGPRGGNGRGDGSVNAGSSNNSRYNVEFFANATNVLNHVNYMGYSGNLLSPFFGEPTRAGQARRVEVGVQFRF